MTISIPSLSLVVLIGPSGSGKSTFARRHFKPTEVLSSDSFRALVGDDENDQAVTQPAFEALHFVAAKRLALGRLTVIDATNVQVEARQPLVHLARQHHCLPVAIVLNLPERTCQERNAARLDRAFGPHVVRGQVSQLRRSLRSLGREGFRHVFILDSPEAVEAAVVQRTPLWNDRREDHGPFDIIGDVHGCCDELESLLGKLGYVPAPLAAAEGQDPVWGSLAYAHPQGRRVVFLGDLVDRGSRVVDTLRLARNMVVRGAALAVPGNHDVKLVKKLRGRNVQVTHGLEKTLAEIDALPEGVRERFGREAADFLESLVSHYVLDGGRLVVAHAGMKEEMQGRASGKVRDFALYGETTGETDEFGLPVRLNWAAEYRGAAAVVYGHTPVPEPEWLNRTVNVDTGCVFGGKLTALRWPEKELVSVPAARQYSVPARPFLPEAAPAPAGGLTAQQAHDEVLDVADVLGKRVIATRLRGQVMVREAQATAALEVMSRFAANPKWIITLPPTMSPCETSREPGVLEHPREAFAYYREQGAGRVVCEEKHMGSRAVVVACRDEAAARARFGVREAEAGSVLTRTGRRFFTEEKVEREFLDRLRAALTAAGTWEALQTAWVCLDCELMPWSAKAQELLKGQYAAVGAAGGAALPRAVAALEAVAGRLEGDEKFRAEAALAETRRRTDNLQRFVEAYRRYCWPVASVADLRLAPFHLLASEGKVHVERDHLWHLEMLAAVGRADPGMLLATPFRVVDLANPADEQRGVDWWEELTARGGEGMVVKPVEFVLKGPKGLAQPAVKVRGREYLWIIYGPDYTEPGNLERLRARGLGHKRALALGEFALGIEALERFVRGEPLRRVHECVFGVLALESEPVDPRL